MTEELLALLNAQGWSVPRLEPLLLEHDGTGVVAQGEAATLVVEALTARAQKQASPNTADLLQELSLLLEEPLAVVATAEREDTEIAWELAYSLVFNAPSRTRTRELMSAFSLSLSYYDPDTSYREDVKAYVNALQDLKRRLRPFMEALHATD